MLINSKTLKGFSVHARDGELGVVDELYFDDQSWAIRYFTIETGGWLAGRPVLISPISVLQADWVARQFHVSLTKAQIEHSPDIDTHRPVSRRHEAEYLGYYGYPYYWGGPMMWGPAFYPASLAVPAAAASKGTVGAIHDESPDSHLRCTSAVIGYGIEATDGEIGHVDGFLVDDTTWAIRYMEVATKNWWPGKKVLVSPAWIHDVSWLRSQVTIDVSRESIRSAPEYAESVPVTLDYEDRLFRHYGKTPSWLHPDARHEDARHEDAPPEETGRAETADHLIGV